MPQSNTKAHKNLCNVLSRDPIISRVTALLTRGMLLLQKGSKIQWNLVIRNKFLITRFHCTTKCFQLELRNKSAALAMSKMTSSISQIRYTLRGQENWVVCSALYWRLAVGRRRSAIRIRGFNGQSLLFIWFGARCLLIISMSLAIEEQV